MADDATHRLTGKVAVVTGAAGGIGLALAMEAARRGMAVALADLGGDNLDAARRSVAALGVAAIAVPTDVRDLAAVEALRDRAEAELGPPWLVANNAGVTRIALAWDHGAADWRRVIDINLFGVVNGLLAFLPGLRARRAGHVINTASAAGLLAIPAAAAYVASKHAVVGLSETLYRELEASDSGVGVSVLCPALVRTNIMGEGAITSPNALDPDTVARMSFEAILAQRFWILTHAAHMAPFVRARTDQMLAERNPDGDSVDPDVARTSSEATGVDFTAHQMETADDA